MPVLAYLGLCFATFLLVKILVNRRSPPNIPPYPAMAWPVCGHLLYFRHGIRPQIATWARSSGDIFSLRFGSRLFVVLNSFKVVHQAFVKNADALTRAKIITIPENELGVFSSSNNVWKDHRVISIQILRSFGMDKNILAGRIREEVSAYLEALSQLAGKPADVRTLTMTVVSNAICSIIVGKRFHFDDEFFTKFMDILKEYITLTSIYSTGNSFEWLRYIPGDLFKVKRKIYLFKYVQTYFCQHFIKKTDIETISNNIENFIGAHFSEIRKVENQQRKTTLSEKNLAIVLFNLFLAGIDSTSTSMLWFMIYMVHYPAVQAKIFGEIKERIGTRRQPDMDDRAKLNYTNAAILETHRLSSINPYGLPYTCTSEIRLAGYTVPVGATVIANMDQIMLSEKTWEDPLEFRPERFLSADGSLAPPNEFIPFSVGKRKCLGEALGKMQLFLFLTALVQKFELRQAVSDELPLREPLDGLVNPPKPFKIRFVERQEYS